MPLSNSPKPAHLPAPKPAHLIVGKRAETQAVKCLQKNNLILVMRNFTCKHGEVDAVMRDKLELVFVEIRYRKSPGFGGAVESIGVAKQTRIKKTAEIFMQEYTHEGHHGCRFDVVAVHPRASKPARKNAFLYWGRADPDFEFDWIQNAFW